MGQIGRACIDQKAHKFVSCKKPRALPTSRSKFFALLNMLTCNVLCLILRKANLSIGPLYPQQLVFQILYCWEFHGLHLCHVNNCAASCVMHLPSFTFDL
jgi:hypothetical protein